MEFGTFFFFAHFWEFVKEKQTISCGILLDSASLANTYSVKYGKFVSGTVVCL